MSVFSGFWETAERIAQRKARILDGYIEPAKPSQETEKKTLTPMEMVMKIVELSSPQEKVSFIRDISEIGV